LLAIFIVNTVVFGVFCFHYYIKLKKYEDIGIINCTDTLRDNLTKQACIAEWFKNCTTQNGYILLLLEFHI
jgi:hypothetical protein